MVRMPLSAPVIVAGIRTAAVMGVGIATLSAFIGAGGLGQFINRGLALSNTRLILLGAVPAALLALLIDYHRSLRVGAGTGKTGAEKGSFRGVRPGHAGFVDSGRCGGLCQRRQSERVRFELSLSGQKISRSS